MACAQRSIALPDMHSGYGFAIGNVAAFDMADPQAVVSPGGVGFDINCGVRLIRTNLVRGCARHHQERRRAAQCKGPDLCCNQFPGEARVVIFPSEPGCAIRS